MNDLIIDAEVAMPSILDERAIRIRGLVAVARHTFIEIGRELIAASDEVPQGEWGRWLNQEFQWTDDTARNFMKVAEVFGSRRLRGPDGNITITQEALYALAQPRVPKIVRDEAIQRAEKGEKITKAEAQKMIREALEQEAARNQELVQQAEAKAAAALREASTREKQIARQAQDYLDGIRQEAEARTREAEARAERLRQEAAQRETELLTRLSEARAEQRNQEVETQIAVDAATKALANDKAALEAELQRIKERVDFAARTAAKQIENLELELEQERTAKPELPRYGTIVIDPPWPMKKIDREVRPNQVDFDYPTMTEEELAAFPVKYMAEEDCHLFCWTTQKFLPMTLSLLGQWGFKYVLTMVWHKPGGFQPIGLPQYNCEFVVYGRRGSPTFADTKAFPTCFEAPRREHSRKPDEFYNMILRVTGDKRIDVFSRELRDGFDQYGFETDKFGTVNENV
jgi:N6-adenosine-specific RNA methylase IME4